MIAVIDSGCDIEHPSLRSNIIDVANFTDYSNPYDVQDNVYHGTHVSGIIASNNFAEGVVGMAPASKLLILKAFDSMKNSSFTTVIDAMNFAINWRGINNEKVNIINLSLGSKIQNPKLKKVIKKAIKQEILIVSVSGNHISNFSSNNNSMYPSNYPGVLQVGAVNEKSDIALFSNLNKKVNYLAPGTNILSTIPYNNYARFSGTSMAAPHVSGLIALLLKVYSFKQINQITKKIFKQESLSSIHYKSFFEQNNKIKIQEV